ncbi:ANKRD44 [Symbiodinium natans]|uniref:ANKRD44 protein n=1 Tax=Symbiodinium natans TaxID=878477 RepID=A0A812TTX9_9DINO|nr:ANKRD44 [Symbiodinium natans]
MPDPGDSSRSSSPGVRDDAVPELVVDAGDRDALLEAPKPRASQATLTLPARVGRTSRTRGRLSVMQADALKSSRAALEQRHHLHSNVSNASEDTQEPAVSQPLSVGPVGLASLAGHDDIRSLVAEMTVAREALQSARDETEALAALGGDMEDTGNGDGRRAEFAEWAGQRQELEAEVLELRASREAQRQASLEIEKAEDRMSLEISEQKHQLALQTEAGLQATLEMQAQQETMQAMKRECESLRQGEQKQADLKAEVSEEAEVAAVEMRQLQEAVLKDEQRKGDLAKLELTVAESRAQEERRLATVAELEAAKSDQKSLQAEVSEIKAEASELHAELRESRSCEVSELSLAEERAASTQRAQEELQELQKELHSELRSWQVQEEQRKAEQEASLEQLRWRSERRARELEELRELEEECQRFGGQERARQSEVEALRAEVARQSRAQEELRGLLSQEQERNEALVQAEHRLSAALSSRRGLEPKAGVSDAAGVEGHQGHQELSMQMESLRQQELDLKRAIAAHRYVVRNSTSLPLPAPAPGPTARKQESADASADEDLEDEIGTTVKLSSRPSSSECQDFLFALRRSGMSGSTISWLQGAT